MTYQDQRSDDHPEAVRSDPVPVQRSAPDDDSDDRDDEQAATDADASERENDSAEVERGYHDSAEQEPEDQPVDDRGTLDEPVDDEDRDGVEDRDEETASTEEEVRDQSDVYHQAEDDRTGYDEPVVASPVDTDTERAGVDSSELEREREEDRDAFGGPTFPESAMAPAAFGAATGGGAAAAAAMAANRTDTRTDVESVDADVAQPDRGDGEFVHEGEPADEPAEAAELMPGEVDAEPVAALVAVEAAQGFRDRWREVQLRFVDDPRRAAAEAQGLAEEAADALVAALDAMRSDLGGWEATEGGDTEHLRVVVRRYRDFLDRVLQS